MNRWRALAVVIVGAFVALFASAPAHADRASGAAGGGAVAGASQHEEDDSHERRSGDRGDDSPAEESQLVLLLDASSSMLEPASGSTTRIEAAREALNTVIDGLEPHEQVGFRVFGATEQGLDNPASCEDSQLLVPVGADNRGDLRRAVTEYEPYGETPIAYAIEQAAGDLSGGGPRSILLVSDGEANCDPDPCDVAEELVDEGVELIINTVGLNVEGAARSDLRCIADATDGEYVDADDADSLVTAMDALSRRALRPFGTTGEQGSGDHDVALGCSR